MISWRRMMDSLRRSKKLGAVRHGRGKRHLEEHLEHYGVYVSELIRYAAGEDVKIWFGKAREDFEHLKFPEEGH